MSDMVERVARASEEVERLSRELDITNADHIALWLEGNTIQDEPMSQCVSWLACRIVEAHERAIAAMQADAAPVATHRHKKRGTLYTVIGEAELQDATGLLCDGAEMVIYRGENGQTWVRHKDEFHDGRFEAVADRVSTSSPVDDREAVLNATQRHSTSGKLRDAVEVWEDAYRAWDDAPTNPDRIGDEDRAAAAVIEADRAALVAEIVAWLRDKAIIHRSKWGMSVDPRTEELADMIEAKWGGK